MNYLLLDPDRTGFPDHIAASASVGEIRAVAYSKLGTYLAAGRSRGDIWILANNTFTPLFRLNGHSAAITTLGFSSDNARLVSGASDGQVLVWDLLTPRVLFHFRLRASIVKVLMYPTNNRRVLVLPRGKEPVEFTLGSAPSWANPLRLTPQQILGLDVESRRWYDQLFGFTSAAFDPCGQYLLLGTEKGLLAVYSVATGQLVHIERNARTPILQIEFSANCRDVLLNCRSHLKVVEMQATRSQVSFGYATKCNHPAENGAEGGAWTRCAFDPSGELIAGIYDANPDHRIHLFERGGDPHSTLLGPGDRALDLAWHPLEPTLVLVEGGGALCLWAPSYQQRWSGYAPKFRELTTNCLIQEEEDAYDLEYGSPTHATHQRPPALSRPCEEVVVDIEGGAPLTFYELALTPKPSTPCILPPSITVDRPSGCARPRPPAYSPRHSPSYPEPRHRRFSNRLPPRSHRANGSRSRRSPSPDTQTSASERPSSPPRHKLSGARSPSWSPHRRSSPNGFNGEASKRRGENGEVSRRRSECPRPNLRSRSKRSPAERPLSPARHSPYSRRPLLPSSLESGAPQPLYPAHPTRFGSASLHSPDQFPGVTEVQSPHHPIPGNLSQRWDLQAPQSPSKGGQICALQPQGSPRGVEIEEGEITH
ncbi:Retinoblastoma-binding protein 5 [Massospora cicadina]|nr:Retinoblastoma-binding protein 5 [Massospora cicadina]